MKKAQNQQHYTADFEPEFLSFESIILQTVNDFICN